jgi:hypothetical protein
MGNFRADGRQTPSCDICGERKHQNFIICAESVLFLDLFLSYQICFKKVAFLEDFPCVIVQILYIWRNRGINLMA